jgi:DNA-binding SARP family transcriptional activator/Tfp pilus assembly protein PilF
MTDLSYHILGPVEVRRGGLAIPIRAPKQCALLAMLLLHANEVVPAGRLVSAIWGEQPPGTAGNVLQTLVFRLRRLLEGEASPPRVLLTRRPGYLIDVPPGALDLHEFTELLAAGRRAAGGGAPERAARLVGDALQLWRGPVAADLPEAPRWPETGRLEDQRLDARELRFSLELALGRHVQAVDGLRLLVAEHPLREGAWAQLMTALYRADRQAEALEAYRRLHRILDRELGVDPSPRLRRLHQQILNADPALRVPAPPPAGQGGGSPATAAAASRAVARVVPRQLPADVPDFTGRHEYLTELAGLLPPAASIVAITGTAGVGKTALAVHWAHRIRDRFPDGQLYVGLRGHAGGQPVRPVEALARFLHALGVPAEQVPIDLDEAADLCRSLLADRQALVLLDGAASAEQVRPLLPGGPTCLVVVTSRDRLDGLVAREGAHRLTLDVLTPAQAGELLSRIIGQDRAAAEPGPVAELARSCVHLPLALRVAAANVAGDPHRSIGQYLADLAASTPLAELQVAGDQRCAVRIAFDHSYTTLAPAAQRLLRLFGLVPGPDLTVPAAAALIGGPALQARRQLDVLAAAHLVAQHAPGRFALHDLLREYARERAEHQDEPAERAAAVDRLAGWYLHTTDAAVRRLYPRMARLAVPSPDPVVDPLRFAAAEPAMAWLDAERANLVATARHAAAQGPRPVAWLLADALRDYFWLRRHTVQWLVVAREALAAADADGDQQARAAARLCLGLACWSLGRHAEAVEQQAAALRLAIRARWRDGVGLAHCNLAGTYRELGQLRLAADHLRRALAGHGAGEERRAALLGNLGILCWELGDLDQATAHLRAALAGNQIVSSAAAQAHLLGALGGVLHARGQLTTALVHLDRAVAMCRQAGSRYGEAGLLVHLGAAALDAGDPVAALGHATAGLDLAREIGDRQAVIEALNVLGTIELRLDHTGVAVQRHQEALQLAGESGARHLEAESLIGLATARWRRGQSDRGLRHATQAELIACSVEYRLPLIRAQITLATIQLDLRRPGLARRHAGQAVELAREAGYRLGLGRALVVLGRASLETDGPATAGRHWRRARALLADAGSGTGEVDSLLDTVALLAASRPTQAALTGCGR